MDYLLTIAYSQTKEQKQAGQKQINRLEFPGELGPGTVRGAGESQSDEQGRIGGIEYIGESVAKGKSQDTQLGIDAEVCGYGNDQGDQQECFCGAGADEEIHAKHQ